MPMEAAAMDNLVDKGKFRPQVAQAISDAIDITIKSANVVTVPILDARFATHEANMEIRFGSIEKCIEATKVWATLLYASLTIALFGALAMDHHWLVSREDQLMTQTWARSDASVAEQQTRIDRRFAEEAQSRAHFAEQQMRADALSAQREARYDQLLRQSEARISTKLDQLRTLIIAPRIGPP